jgi:2-dehydropantoate 2-reductase
MRIIVIGPGGVGGYFGAHLARAGHDVTFVARGDHGRAISRDGITIDEPDGSFTEKVSVSFPEDAPRPKGDVVLIAVKAKDYAAILPQVRAWLAPSGVAIPLLNGLDSERLLAEALGPGRVIGAIAQIASEIAAPGRLRVRERGRMVLAPLHGEEPNRAASLAAEFAKAAFSCKSALDLDRLLWGKLLWNAPFNAICALTGLSAGEVLAIPELEALVRRSMVEVVAAAHDKGVSIPESAIEETLASTRKHFAQTVPSMLQDLERGRLTEVSALQGAVVRAAAESGSSAPLHETFVALIRGREASIVAKR